MKTKFHLLQIWLLWAAMLPAAVHAQFAYTTNNGAITITDGQNASGVLVIPSTINGLPVTSIWGYAFQNSGLTSVTIPSSVTNLGQNAFADSYSMTGIYFQGNAPVGVYPLASDNVTVYYQPGTGGWSSQYSGRPTVMLNPPSPAGSLQVTLSPAAAITAGAYWWVDGGIAQPSGAIVTGLSVGSHTVSFGSGNGWASPASQTVVISANSTATAGGLYTQLTYTTNNGAITITGYAGSPGASMAFPSTANGLPVTSIGGFAFASSSFTNVTFPSSVTNLGQYAFAYCYNLTGIYFQANAPAAGSGIFANDPSPVYYLPGTSGWGSTLGGHSAVMLNPPSPKGSLKVTVFPAAATNGAQWQVDGGVSQPSGAIVNGLSVGSHLVRFSPVDGWVAPINQSVTVSANTTNTASGSYYQLTCTTNNGAITITGYSGLGGSVVLPSILNGLPVIAIGTNAFQNASNSLTSITIPYGITSIGVGAFSNSFNVTNITISSSVTNIRADAFYACYATKIYFQGNAPVIDFTAFTGTEFSPVYYLPGTSGWGASISGRAAVMLNPPSPAGSLRVMPTPAWTQWQVDGGVVQPSGATVTGLSVGNHTISFCPANGWAAPGNQMVAVSANTTASASAIYDLLTYTTNNGAITITGIRDYFGNYPHGFVILPGAINGLPVTSIGNYAFYDCTSLFGVALPNSVTSIGSSAFQYCYSLTNLAIPDSVASIAGGAFNHSSGLAAFTVDPASLHYSSTNGILFNKDQTTLVQFPVGLGGNYTIPTNVTTIGPAAFDTCDKLTSITIPYGVINIQSSAFAYCKGLTSIALPDSVDIIGAFAFEYCTGLTNVTFGSSVSYLQDYAFAGCWGLTNVTLPDSVSAIGDYTFYDCRGLVSVTMGTNLSQFLGTAFPNCPNLTGIYFQGNAPIFLDDWFLLAPDSDATVYFLPWTTGWPEPGTEFGGNPTALWLPQAQTSAASFGVQTNQFGFNITWANDQVVVVDACTDLANPVWIPVGTNTLTGGSSYFSDTQWTNYPGRFYRLRSP